MRYRVFYLGCSEVLCGVRVVSWVVSWVVRWVVMGCYGLLWVVVRCRVRCRVLYFGCYVIRCSVRADIWVVLW